MKDFNITLKHPLNTLEELALIYTPGVGASSKEIAKDKMMVNVLTNRLNSVCVIFDCKDNPETYLPYSQAVAGIIKKITGLDAYPLVNCGYDINKVIKNLEPSFSSFYIFSDNKINDFDFTVIKNKFDDYDFDDVVEKAKKLKKNFIFPTIEYYENPNKDFYFPDLNIEDLKLLNKESKPVILKQNIVKKNKLNHQEILLNEYNTIINNALYFSDFILKTQPQKESNYLFIKCDERTNYTFVIELSNAKKQYEIINFFKVNGNRVKDYIKNATTREGGEILITKRNSLGAARLSALTNSSNINIISDFNDNFNTDEKPINLRKNLKGVIETEDIYRNESIDELREILSKENLEKLRLQIKENPDLARTLTCKQNTVAVISDGSAVLGLGNIGAYAAMPVMEGKAAIFKAQAGINAIPICLKTQNIQEIIDISTSISYSFGGVNLEDINAPRCFEVEEKLSQKTNIPIFHDDQHGTAIIVLAALLSALKLADKKIEDVKIVMSGAGAAAQAVAKLLLRAGAKNIILRDINGVVSKNSKRDDIYLNELALRTNPNLEEGKLADILKGADVLIGLSAANIVSKEMIQTMSEKAIVFVLANPTPEIMPDLAKEAGAFIVATGRSDFENQINNSLAFPGIFKGLLEKNIKKVTDDIKYNASMAIQKYASKNLSEHNILPKALDKEIVEEISKAI